MYGFSDVPARGVDAPTALMVDAKTCEQMRGSVVMVDTYQPAEGDADVAEVDVEVHTAGITASYLSSTAAGWQLC